jgi:hypothetical protein
MGILSAVSQRDHATLEVLPFSQGHAVDPVRRVQVGIDPTPLNVVQFPAILAALKGPEFLKPGVFRRPPIKAPVFS